MNSIAQLVRRRWLALGVVAALASGLFAGCSSLDTQMRKWIFQPAPTQYLQTASHRQRNDGFDDVWIEYQSSESAQPVRLHGLWAANADSAAPLLLYLHGARRNVSRSTFRIRNMRDMGFSVLGIDYRGFGESTDELPSEASSVEDAKAAWDWLASNYAGRDRYIFGHSLGGAIAVALAVRTPDERGLIIEGTFTSIADVYRSWRWGWLPLTPLIGTRFDSAASIARVGSPVLIVHGSDDGTIKAKLGRNLFERAVEPKRFVLVEGATHHNANRLGSLQYRQALAELFGIGDRSMSRSAPDLSTR